MTSIFVTHDQTEANALSGSDRGDGRWGIAAIRHPARSEGKARQSLRCNLHRRAAEPKLGPLSSWKVVRSPSLTPASNTFIRRLADEGCNVEIGGPFLQIVLGGELLQYPTFHHRDPIRQRVGFGLSA